MLSNLENSEQVICVIQEIITNYFVSLVFKEEWSRWMNGEGIIIQWEIRLFSHLQLLSFSSKIVEDELGSGFSDGVDSTRHPRLDVRQGRSGLQRVVLLDEVGQRDADVELVRVRVRCRIGLQSLDGGASDLKQF